MVGRKPMAISERQFAVLRILWTHGPLTVREIAGHFSGREPIPYTTVLGLLQNMEKAELVDHVEEGTTYRYRPRVTEKRATKVLLKDFITRFFKGSSEALLHGLVSSDQVSIETLRALERELEEPSDEAANDEATTSRAVTRKRGTRRE